MARTDSEIVRDIVIKMIEKEMLVKVKSPEDEANNEKNLAAVCKALNAILPIISEDKKDLNIKVTLEDTFNSLEQEKP